VVQQAKQSSPTRLFSRLGNSWLGGARTVAASSIDLGESVARGALDVQKRATAWAKGTRLGPLLQAQNAIATRVVEGSASLARALWRLDRTGEVKSPRKSRKPARRTPKHRDETEEKAG
jgi:hypothetical protein